MRSLVALRSFLVLFLIQTAESSVEGIVSVEWFSHLRVLCMHDARPDVEGIAFKREGAFVVVVLGCCLYACVRK